MRPRGARAIACYRARTHNPTTQIDLIAYADDYTARGELLLREDRLADQLAAADELRVAGVTVQALEDGRKYELPFAVIPRDELCAVATTGPAGSPTRRVRTRPYPMRAQLGPYSVVGYVHAMPTATDPRGNALRRKVVAFSPALLTFMFAGEVVNERLDGLLVLRAKIALLETATDDEVRLSVPPELAEAPDPPSGS